MKLSSLLVWSLAWASALWLAWQKQGDLLSPKLLVPMLILVAIGVWGWYQPKDKV